MIALTEIRAVAWIYTTLRQGWRHLYRHRQWKGFVDWRRYYARFLDHESRAPLISHNVPLVGDQRRHVDVLNQLAGGRSAVVVTAPPGCGKSRFGIELCKRIERVPRHWGVRVVSHDLDTVRAEVHELSRLQRIVLILDDAQEVPDLVRLLGNFVASAPESCPVHLVCLTRPAGRADVDRALSTSFPPGDVEYVDLDRPSAKLIGQLIDELLPSLDKDRRDVIARFVGRSYFSAVLVCRAIARERHIAEVADPNELRDRVCRQPIREAIQDMCPLDKALRCLAVYAALSPTYERDVPVKRVAAHLSDLSLIDVELVLERMLTGGLFERYGRGLIRPTPDLFGDLILEEVCLDGLGHPQPFARELVSAAFEISAPRVVVNCADIGQLFSPSMTAGGDLVSSLLLQRVADIEPDDSMAVSQVLQSSRALIARQPQTVLKIFDVLLGRGVFGDKPPPDSLDKLDSHECHAMQLLLSASEHDPSIVPRGLEYAKSLYDAARASPAGEKFMQEQLDKYCRFSIGRPIVHARAVIGILEQWATSADSSTVALAVPLAANFLRLIVRGERAGAMTFTMYTSLLNPVDAVFEVRDRAIDIITRGCVYPESQVQYSAVRALERFAQADNLSGSLGDGSAWSPRLAREIPRVVEALGKTFSCTSSLPVRGAIENQAWNWWIHGNEHFAIHALELLRHVPDDDAYNLWKALHNDQLPLLAVLPTPEERYAHSERLDYYHCLTDVRAEHSTGLAQKLFDVLDSRISSSDEWHGLFRHVAAQRPAHSLQWRANLYVSEFVQRHPEIAWSMMNGVPDEHVPWTLVPLLLSELRKGNAGRWRTETARIAIGSRLHHQWLRAMWGHDSLSKEESALLRASLQLSDVEFLHRAAEAFLSVRDPAIAAAFAEVFPVLDSRPDDASLWGIVIREFYSWASGVLAPGSSSSDEDLRATSERLLASMRTHEGAVPWAAIRSRHHLTNALAILATVRPEQTADWIHDLWTARSESSQAVYDMPLSQFSIGELFRPVTHPDAVSFWKSCLSEWMFSEAHLAEAAAHALAEICPIDDPFVIALAERVAGERSHALPALARFLTQHKSVTEFPHTALEVLSCFSQDPRSYATLEERLLWAFEHASTGHTIGQTPPEYANALDILSQWEQREHVAPPVRATLARVRKVIQEAIERSRLSDEEVTAWDA